MLVYHIAQHSPGLVLVYFPAEAARCAGEQEAYWATHDQLFAEQANWAGRSDNASIFKRYASDLGLDAGAFEDCLASGRWSGAVDADIADGQVGRVAIHSRNGGTCRMVNPWPGRTVQVTCNGDSCPFDEAGDIIVFDTAPGRTYAIQAGEPPATPVWDMDSIGPLCYRGPAWMGDMPTDRREAVWLGIPEGDG